MGKKFSLPTMKVEYFLLFLIVYAPRVSDFYLGFRVEFIVIITLLIMLLRWFKQGYKSFEYSRGLMFWIISVLTASFYFSIRAAFANEPLRYFQNLYIIVQVIYVFLLNDILNRKGYTWLKKFDILIKLAVLQGVISLLMITFPPLKNIALDLYYLGREENMFISRMRIYGISGEYTFFTPIYHGILAAICIYFGLEIHKKYYIYFPFILLVVIMNGRTGLIPIFISIILLLIRNKNRSMKINILMVASVFLTIVVISYLIKIISPYTYKWLLSAFSDFKNLFLHGELTGTLKVLFDDYLFFPDIKGMIFGNGYRVYGGNAVRFGYGNSDIGYVNDLFMGGAIYMSILYYANLKYVLSYASLSDSTSKKDFIKFLKWLVFIVLILSNLKGEVMRSGLLLLSAIMFGIFLEND